MNRYNLSPHKKIDRKMAKGRRVIFDTNFYDELVAKMYSNAGIEDIAALRFMKGTVIGSFGPKWEIKWDNGWMTMVAKKHLSLVHEPL